MNTVYKQGFYDRVPLYMPRACPRQLYKGRGRTRVQYTVFILCFIVCEQELSYDDTGHCGQDVVYD